MWVERKGGREGGREGAYLHQQLLLAFQVP